MEFAAFLRGINISGRNRIPMPELKAEFERLGFSGVATFLNSGNLIFTSDATDAGSLRSDIEDMIKKRFGLEIPVHVIETDSLKKTLYSAPEWWGSGSKDRYDNLIFILSGESPSSVAELVGPVSEGLETIQVADHAIFWTFDRKLYQKCNWWKKTASPGIAEKLTIRTAGTIRKMVD